jgi:N-acetylneuraminate synthase
MVNAIRDIEVALGDGVKGPRPSEIKNKHVARKSLVAAISINSGTPFSEHNLEIKRPGTGISPIYYWELLEKKSTRDYQAGDIILD